jgi:hypothetical protein
LGLSQAFRASVATRRAVQSCRTILPRPRDGLSLRNRRSSQGEGRPTGRMRGDHKPGALCCHPRHSAARDLPRGD